MYPATLSDLKLRTALIPLLTARSDADLTQALLSAQGEVELPVPAAYDGDLGVRLDRAAWALHLDMAVWYLRTSVERDPNTGGTPADLQAIRATLDSRLSMLAKNAALQTGMIVVEATDALGDPPAPRAPFQ